MGASGETLQTGKPWHADWVSWRSSQLTAFANLLKPARMPGIRQQGTGSRPVGLTPSIRT